MGLFNFAKGAGASIFKSDEKKTESIRKHILGLLEKQGNRLDNLTVEFDAGVVKLTGACDTLKTKEKAILMAGNIEDVTQVNGDGLALVQAGGVPKAGAAAQAKTPQQPKPGRTIVSGKEAPDGSQMAAGGATLEGGTPIETSAPSGGAVAMGGEAPVKSQMAAGGATLEGGTPAGTSAPAGGEAPAGQTPEPESQFYTIQAGDSLSKIAKQFYGNANKYTFIFEENRGVIDHPDRIYPGQVIRIPPVKM